MQANVLAQQGSDIVPFGDIVPSWGPAPKQQSLIAEALFVGPAGIGPPTKGVPCQQIQSIKENTTTALGG